MATLKQIEPGGPLTPGVKEQPGQHTKACSQNENRNKSLCDCSKSIFMTTPIEALSGNFTRSGNLGKTLPTFCLSLRVRFYSYRPIFRMLF